MAPMLPLWPCSSTCNDGLVQNLQKVGIVRSAAVFDAMKRTDRALFVPRAVQDEAYQDSPCPIGFNQIISAPHMHAQVLELAHASFSSPPQAMLDQLADRGQLVIPVDDPRGGQALVSVTRRGSCLLHRKLMPACFVPLVRGEIYKNRRGVTSTDSELQQ
ncbi:hypothetical protein F442_10463 [Phytophthora nicotianae P10297]|uniref:protein-L-isoaspartate(D-aspartate) O-methyltransferase n=1 Tax=Phytophthora nicotianae P10297 TaxID=1317064 RepID=W2Z5S7_PHYNI|nr:hypothetical protein F442_10463 [Phytophthora nicotianae P10297]